MKYIQYIIRLIKFVFCVNTPKKGGLDAHPRFLVQPEHAYQYAFSIGDKKYYYFEDEFQIPACRALVALDVYEELNQRIDRLYLESLFESLINLFNKGDLVQASKLVLMAQSRMQNITNIDLLYKMAAVRFFTENENPYETSMVEIEQKAKFFKAHSESVDSFFLGIPMAEYLPYGQTSDMTLQSYSQAQAKELIEILEAHTNILSEGQSESDLLSKLKSQIEAVKASLN